MNEPDNNDVRNTYDDEQAVLNEMTEEVCELWLSISELLTEKGYKMRAVLVNGIPDVILEKDKHEEV